MCTREICTLCYEINRVGFWVPDKIWQAVVPKGYEYNILCLRCFTRIADEKAIEWDKEIKFYPVSWTTHKKGN
jgi:hypothetical protein